MSRREADPYDLRFDGRTPRAGWIMDRRSHQAHVFGVNRLPKALVRKVRVAVRVSVRVQCWGGRGGGDGMGLCRLHFEVVQFSRMWAGLYAEHGGNE